MARSTRINVTLAPRELATLGWLAGERTQLPAALARTLIEQGLERAKSEAALQESYRDWRAGFSYEERIAPHIAAAVAQPGVVRALSGDHTGCSVEELRLASWLVAVSAWWRDPRPGTVKGAPPARDTWTSLSLPHGAADVAFDEIDETVSQALRARPARGGQTASDKRQLSDVAPHEPPQEVNRAPARR